MTRRLTRASLACQLTPRDRELLHAVGRMGHATAEHLRLLFFGRDASTAFRRLRKLAHIGLLKRHVLHVNEPNVYTLAARGLRILVEDGADESQLHCCRVGQHRDRHLELLNDVRVALAIATKRDARVELTAFHADLDLRRAAGSSPPSYIPDGIAVLRIATRVLVLVLEIDTGSEAVAVFGEKVRVTVDLWQRRARCWGAEPGSWCPVAFVPSAARARALARAIVASSGGSLWLVAEFERLRAEGALGPIFGMADEVVSTPRHEPIRYRGALTPALAEGTIGAPS